ncbi:Hvo_1808 family surface protein [Halobacteriales archaeon Cl-PHB]
MRRLPLLGLLALVVLSGCTYGVESAPVAPNVDDYAGDDRLGWEGGYAWNDEVTISGDSVTPAEREAMMARAMARIERLRGLEFTERVEVRVISRQEYLAESANRSVDPVHSRWNDQVWEALFLVGADRNVSNVFDETYGSAVKGYYAPASDEIVIVGGDGASISRGTLVHELVHALQDQQFGIEAGKPTQDGQLARNGVIEGEANRIQSQYESRCGESWECVTVPRTGGGGGGGSLSQAARNVLTVIYMPYATGPGFVAAVEDRGGHDALNALYDDLPRSTEQVLHPQAYPDDRPVNVTVPDRSGSAWNRFDHDPVADTVGEASIFVTVTTHDLGDTRVGQYTYRHPISEGWAGDAVVPYTDGQRGGYVWETAWDSQADATEFHDAMVELLGKVGATKRGDGVWTVPEDSTWRGAYRVVADGTRVRIVHGPTVASLDRIHGR